MILIGVLVAARISLTNLTPRQRREGPASKLPVVASPYRAGRCDAMRPNSETFKGNLCFEILNAKTSLYKAEREMLISSLLVQERYGPREEQSQATCGANLYRTICVY